MIWPKYGDNDTFLRKYEQYCSFLTHSILSSICFVDFFALQFMWDHENVWVSRRKEQQFLLGGIRYRIRWSIVRCSADLKSKWDISKCECGAAGFIGVLCQGHELHGASHRLHSLDDKWFSAYEIATDIKKTLILYWDIKTIFQRRISKEGDKGGFINKNYSSM